MIVHSVEAALPLCLPFTSHFNTFWWSQTRMQHMIHIKGLQRAFRIYLHISLCIISASWLSEIYCWTHSSFDAGRHCSALRRHHLQLLLVLGGEPTSGFHIGVGVSCLTVGTHLEQFQKRVSGNLFISNLTMMMMITEKYRSLLAELTYFPLWPVWKILQQLILWVTSLIVQPVTPCVMSPVLILYQCVCKASEIKY